MGACIAKKTQGKQSSQVGCNSGRCPYAAANSLPAALINNYHNHKHHQKKIATAANPLGNLLQQAKVVKSQQPACSAAAATMVEQKTLEKHVMKELME